MLSQDEFVKQSGGRCPNCRGGQIEGKGFDYDGGAVWQKVICSDCQAEWTEVYDLARYQDLTVKTAQNEG